MGICSESRKDKVAKGEEGALVIIYSGSLTPTLLTATRLWETFTIIFVTTRRVEGFLELSILYVTANFNTNDAQPSKNR